MMNGKEDSGVDWLNLIWELARVAAVAGVLLWLWFGVGSGPRPSDFERELRYYRSDLPPMCITVGENLAGHISYEELRSRTVENPPSTAFDTLASLSPSSFWREHCVTSEMRVAIPEDY